MKKLYFITGSQDLYGEETLEKVANDSKTMVEYLDNRFKEVCHIKWTPTVRNSEEITEVMEKASSDRECIGVICWMHTFSPAKMWIKGLQRLSKPLLHLHTQANETLPYESIDMDFMNLNQSAHGDREFGFILSRLNIPHHVVVGYYKDEKVLNEIDRFIRVTRAIDVSHNLRVAMFGNNMRDVAVTDGDRVESQIRYGWEVNYYGIGDLIDIMKKVRTADVDLKMNEYASKYIIDTKNIDSIREQAKMEVALEKFIKKNDIGAFTDTFEDLHGLKQLPGLTVQNLMDKGIGFAAEGDYKTSAMNAVLMSMSDDSHAATGFMEDYTYDFRDEIELGSHMLEVSPRFAAEKPKIQVHPLGIGGKEDPARLVFKGIKGDGIAVGMTDMGDHFRLIVTGVELIEQPKEMPKLPVARLMWRIKPSFEEGVRKWLEAGGGHHTVLSRDITKEDIRLFAKLTNTELIEI